ncbi:LysR family transcriptional regulator [Paraburkholderia dipogonis]|uniref:LysR family transcriptional regulator n=1 Tax=Paraburkholderia dipogonis TaxID=1211383 RepID=UPI0031342A04
MGLIPQMHSMHIRDLDLNLLVLFDALLRERSVTRAAGEVGLSQGAMSHALNRLRTFFEDPLFIKTPAGMEPTEKAVLLGITVTEVMTALRDRVVSQAYFDPATARRTFVICMTDMGEFVFLPPLVRRLRKVAPHCTVRSVQVPPEQLEATLAAGEADLALGSVRAAPGGLYQQQLFLHTFVTMVSVHNKTIGRTISRAQFERAPQIVVSLTGRASSAYDSAFDEYGIKRNIFLTTPHFLCGTTPHPFAAGPDRHRAARTGKRLRETGHGQDHASARAVATLRTAAALASAIPRRSSQYLAAPACQTDLRQLPRHRRWIVISTPVDILLQTPLISSRHQSNA